MYHTEGWEKCGEEIVIVYELKGRKEKEKVDGSCERKYGKKGS